MDELALLRELADATPLPDAEHLAPARARLTSAMTMTAAEPATARRLPPDRPRRRRRLWLPGVTAAGIAAAITAVVALGGREPVSEPPANAAAVEILRDAAAAARALPDTPPRPDQFVYTKTEGPGDYVREAWLSADGTHDGLIMQLGDVIPLPGCRNGQSQAYKGPNPIPGLFTPCEPYPAYDPDLPTDAAGMRDYVTTLPGTNDKTNSLAKNIYSLVGENYVRPASLAALFEAAAHIDGLTIEENVTDGAGRPGVGVSWTNTNTITLVFDRHTYAFLGVAGSDAVVQRAVVDVAGQRP